ncbi:MAG: SCO family protein [Pseudomonadota bacterium]
MMVRALALAVGAAMVAPAVAQEAFDDLGGSFALTDQTGAIRTETDPEGHAQLLFFGYANCQEICSAALPLMGEVADILEAEGTPVTPVMVTVDPARDTVEDIGPPLEVFHNGFIGLTGTEDELQVAYDAFGIEFEELFIDPFYGPVYAHGSFIYLLDAEGGVLTMLPPILAPDHMAEIIAANIGETS